MKEIITHEVGTIIHDHFFKVPIPETQLIQKKRSMIEDILTSVRIRNLMDMKIKSKYGGSDSKYIQK